MLVPPEGLVQMKAFRMPLRLSRGAPSVRHFAIYAVPQDILKRQDSRVDTFAQWQSRQQSRSKLGSKLGGLITTSPINVQYDSKHFTPHTLFKAIFESCRIRHNLNASSLASNERNLAPHEMHLVQWFYPGEIDGGPNTWLA